jgi:hypothetical protein
MEETMSNLYMTTEEFAAIVVDALHEQNYFKKSSKNHPQDIAISFATVGESIGVALSWAISKEHQAKKDLKEAVMHTGNLSKNVSGSWASASTSSEHAHVLPIDEEISPTIEKEEPLVTPRDALEYSEWKRGGYL